MFNGWKITNILDVGLCELDSKGHGLPEPPMWKVEALIKSLKESGIEIREKHNLERLMR